MMSEPESTPFSCVTPDGVCLHGQHWRGTGQPWCQIALIHGLGEHLGRYTDWIERLTSEGVDLIGCDLRGHGRSPGRRGGARGLGDHLYDCDALVSRRDKSLPLVLYGHSLGGLVVLEYLRQRGREGVAGAIITSPWLKLAFQPPTSKVLLARMVSRLAPHLTVRSGLRAESLGRPAGVAEAYREDPLVHGRISVGLFSDAVRAGQFWADEAAGVSVPMLLMHGCGDEVTCCGATEQLAARCGEGVSLQLWPDAVHELHHDTVADLAFASILGWLKRTRNAQ